ncbi:MAG: 50S ribosomal protein L10 [Candidatus Omnitrophica bacterium]|nr:50S ribosomal protein L10 [Candidatus Omnitrophota bacterium]
MENTTIEFRQLIGSEIEHRLKALPYLFISSFKGIAVQEQDQLRRSLKEIDASLFVAKNSILKRVLQKLELTELKNLVQGLSALTLGGRDAISVSKALVEFAGKSENFKIIGAYVEQQVLDGPAVKSLALVPPREVLLAQLAGGLKAPLQGLANVLSATIRNFVAVLNKISEQKK